MQHTPDGGPAFPKHAIERHFASDSHDTDRCELRSESLGMSLRDYFAAKALRCVTAGDHVDGQGDPDRHSALAYQYADAMLRAREAK